MIKIVPILFLLIGISLILYSAKLPYYTNSAAKETLEANANSQLFTNQNNTKQFQHIKDVYYKSVEKLRTSKAQYLDLGSGISIASLGLLIFLLIFKVNKLSDFPKIKSLSKRWVYYTAIPVWLLMIPGTYWYYLFRAERGDYPTFSDSIAIPILDGTFTVLIGLVVLIFFLIFTTRKSLLPSFIFIKPYHYGTKNILNELFWGLLLLVNLLCFILFVLGGDHVSIVVNLFFTYLLLTLRSGQINNYNNSHSFERE